MANKKNANDFLNSLIDAIERAGTKGVTPSPKMGKMAPTRKGGRTKPMKKKRKKKVTGTQSTRRGY